MKILVADDEEANSFFLRKMLEKDGHEVTVADDGEQAIAKVDQDIPDLILMDIMMPNMDGYEATKILKKNYEGKFLPILFVSALSANEALINCLEHGGDDYISKPINKEVLTAKITAMERTIRLHQTNESQNKQLKKQQAFLDEEKKIAEEIFSNLLHKIDLDPEFIRCYHKPADTFNGDVFLAVKSPRGGVNILLGDFTGHGLVAAICTLPVVEVFHTMSTKGYSIQDILFEINHKICALLPKGRFFAVDLIHINKNEGYMEVLNAGMPDVLIYNKNSGIKNRILSHNFPLGIVENTSYNVNFQMCELEAGDRIFAYSDGLLEAEDINGKEQYGQDRLEGFIEKNLSSSNMVESIKEDLEKFSRHKNYHDDISFIEIVCDSPQGKLNFSPAKANSNNGNWEFSIKFDHLNLKNTDTVPIVISMLMDIDKKNASREVLLLLITEMFNNALEHGILKLDSTEKNTPKGFENYYQKKQIRLQELKEGYINFKFSQETSTDGEKLCVVVEDSGDGFDANKVLNNIKENESDSIRGLKLVKSFCKHVDFNEKGNEIRVVFEC